MRKVRHRAGQETLSASTYSDRYFQEEVPKYALAEDSMPSDAAYQIIKDELNLDGNPDLNLASFVTTWMEPEAERLAAETLNRNFIDHDEYPQTEELHLRVITMLARLLHAPADAEPVGTATVGSSEAIMLGLLAHKLAWRNRRKAAGLAYDRPNVVMGADVHTCWEKFCAYFDVEARVVPMSRDRFVLTSEEARPHIDENTVAVGAVVGTTYTGQLDHVADLSALLDELEATHGWDIPIHVDAASGGFVLPFTQPDFAWDFRLGRVRSINVSNHKFGLVYPGMGALLLRDQAFLPSEMVFDITYLGGSMPNCSLNFSRSATPVILQYYNFLRLGRAGYARIMNNALANSRHLGQSLEDTGAFEWISKDCGLPVVAVRLLPGASGRKELVAESLSESLRRRGWIVPAYHLPANATDVGVLRMVVKENLSHDLIDMLVADIRSALDDGRPQVAERHPQVGATRAARVIC